jgi:uncharacterized protein YcfL
MFKSVKKLYHLPLIILLFSLFLLSGCSSKEIDLAELMNDITFKAISVSPEINGQQDLTIQMENNSDYTIVQNTVLYSLVHTSYEINNPIRTVNLLVNHNKLDIEPGESVELTVTYPKNTLHEEFEEATFVSENVQFIRYVDKLSDETRVEFIKSLNLENE